MGNRKKKEKQKKALKHRFAKPAPLKAAADPVVVFEPSGQVKMSDVLMDFVAPFEDSWQTPDELRKLLTVAVIAWNAAIAPLEKGLDLLHDTAETVPPHLRADFAGLVVELIRRKLQYFADNRRFVLDFKLIPLPDGEPYLTVMSTLRA
jgi:hypothetical protein